jgi:plasmid stabilization system protein ParE
MKSSYVIRPAADREIDSQVDYLLKHADLDTALRFFDAVHEAVRGLLKMPDKGSLQTFRSPFLTGIRAWPVPGFKKFRVYYRVTPHAIEVMHVLHGAQDQEQVFEDEIQ